MKIVFVISHLTVFVGAGKFLMDYANKFCEKGHSITIVTQKIDRDKYQFNNEILLIEVGGPLPSNPFYWLKFRKIKKKFLNVLNNLDSKLFISLNFPSNYFCANIDGRNSLKHIYYCLEPYRFFHDKRFYSNAPFFLKNISRFLRFYFKKYDIEGTMDADETICISKFTRNRVKEFYNTEGLLHYIGIPITENDINGREDLEIKEILKLHRDKPLIFTLGLSHHLKGAKELIIIFSKILKQIPEAVLLIGGWIIKENKFTIKKYVKKLKIPPANIVFYGFIKNNLLKDFYSQSTLTFYTALDESFGLIPLESMKNGTPVIAFEGGPSETILDGQNGYIIKNEDFKGFAQKAIELIRDKTLYERFSKNSVEYIEKNWNFNKSFLDLEAMFKRISSEN